MSNKVYTAPAQEDCPTCSELVSTECIVEEQSVPSLGLPAGSRLSKIIKYLDKKLKDFTLKFKKVIYNVTPTWTEGITIFSYENESCNGDTLDMKIPLFLNGKDCFNYESDETITYEDELAYVLFFNFTHCGGVFIAPDDTIQITQISGINLTTPIVVKTPTDPTFILDNATLLALLTDINLVTGSTFNDIVTDTTLSVNNDLALGLVDVANASVAFLADLTFTYEVLDNTLALKETVVENILSRNVTGAGIITIATEYFSVNTVMGVSTFYDEVGTEIVDQPTIDFLTDLINNSLVTPTCCLDCSNLAASFTYTGADVDCGAVNLATAGDTMEEILAKVCERFDTILGPSGFFNILQPEDNGNILDVTIFGNANSINVTNDQPLFIDRIGCSDDIMVTITSADGILFSTNSTVLTIPGNQSIVLTEFRHPIGLAAGTYTATLSWDGCGITKAQNITFNLS